MHSANRNNLFFTFTAGLLAAFIWSVTSIPSNAQNNYYFPDSPESEFDEDIPTPQDFLGYEIGSHYTRHDRLVDYFEELAEVSDKVEIQQIGETTQKRPQVVVTITSPDNFSRLNEVREQHLTQLDPEAPALDTETSPSVVALNYSVHGDETSSGEAALLTAYYLTANNSEETAQFLDEAVIHIDPAQNPDGRDRAAHWHNSYKSFPPVADPADIEHNQDWPRGRTNHFLHDLNRDWFAVTQQESENRVDFYHRWYPNIQIDFHEMGTNSTYYLEPTQPERTWNPIIPEHHYEEMNPLLAEYHVDALDGLGSLYWTKEIFDNLSPIYGSTYPDILGGVGVTFEVGSSRGLVQESDAGDVTFRSTIRKHLHTGIATVRAGVSEKERLFEYQKEFFQSALEQADDQSVRAYVFGDENDETLTRKFLDLLLKHRLEVYELSEDLEQNGTTFSAGNGYLVPTNQVNYRIVHDIFEANTSYPDSVFYDITAWSLVHGYGIEHEELASGNYTDYSGPQVSELPEHEGEVKGGTSDYAYLLEWSDYNAPPALYHLLDKGVTARTAHKPFTAPTAEGNREFGYGSIAVAVQEQEDLSPEALQTLLAETAEKYDVDFHAVGTGYTTSGIDLGSTNMQVVEKPKAALVFGAGTSAYEAGEAWFALNKHLGLGVTKLKKDQLPGTSLDRYNTLIMVDGNYGDWDEDTVSKIKSWVQDGGVLIADEGAAEWAVETELVGEDLLVEDVDSSEVLERHDYEEQADRRRSESIPGVILEADIDPSHPIAFGVPDRQQLFIKDNDTHFKQSKNAFATVAKYTDEPFVGGHLSEENNERVRNTAAIIARSEGSGNVILFSENPNFRSYWHTTSRLFLNAVLFGRNISVY